MFLEIEQPFCIFLCDWNLVLGALKTHISVAIVSSSQNFLKKELILNQRYLPHPTPNASDSTGTNDNYLSHNLEDGDLLCKASLDVDPQTISHPHETNGIRYDDETLGTMSLSLGYPPATITINY